MFATIRTVTLCFAITLAIAAIWALIGTNEQAALARLRFREDDDPRIVAAVVAWSPSVFGWVGKKRRKAEAAIRDDPEAWPRYQRMSREMRSWNMLESSVALALPAAVIAAVSSFN